MKIVNSISQIYNEQHAINSILKGIVDTIIFSVKQNNWHYYSRLKTEESFALKLETGRVDNPKALEDFTACTLVVDNMSQIEKALNLLNEHVTIIDRKPNDSSFTHKESSSFIFDDLRLYAKIKPLSSRLEGPINDIIFEIQIKTFLQHAWGIATHDLIYKTKQINWSKERIAYQIKALLENVEVTISGVETLTALPEIAKENKETMFLKQIVSFYNELFNEEDLPNDLVRLSKNTKDLLKSVDLQLEDLYEIIRSETALGKGTKTKNISPYNIIMQSIANQKPEIIEKYCRRNNRFKIMLPVEVDISHIRLKSKDNFIMVG